MHTTARSARRSGRLSRTVLTGGALVFLTAGWLQPAAARPTSARPEVRELSVPVAAADETLRRSAAERSPVGAVLAQLPATRTKPFSTVGVTWAPGTRAKPRVEVRVRTRETWSGWEVLEMSNDADGDEAANARPGTDPLWVGDSTGVEVRVKATAGTADQPAVTDVKVALVDPQVLASDAEPEATQVLAPRTLTKSATVPYLYPAPAIVTRAAWGADEKLRSSNGEGCATPNYDTTIKAAIVHHTAGSNSYRASQSAAIVRGIYAFHTKSRGWCDIGYNLLVDKYGKVFEGRFGGVWNVVHGAHATSWNTDTVGLSLMGNFETARPTKAMMNSAAKVLAWKLEGFYRDPTAKVTLAGKRINVIAGHGDVMATACPGKNVVSQMGKLRTAVEAKVGSFRTPIYARWQQLGGESGPLGSPVAPERVVRDGRVAHFEGGDLLWSPSTGARLVEAPIRTKYRSLGGARHRLGFPTSDQQAGVLGSRRQRFQDGTIYSSPTSGTADVYGAFHRYYQALGPDASRLGLPTASQRAGAVKGSHVQSFERGGLYWLSSTGAQEVSGAIFTTYQGLGAESSSLGMPVRGPYATPGGWASDFQGGRITFDSTTEETEVTFS
jgi:hypothetical protein